MGTWPDGIDAITLFVEDLGEGRRFYQEIFDLPVAFEDDNSVVFNFGNTIINLLMIDSGERTGRAGGGRGTRCRLADAVHDRC